MKEAHSGLPLQTAPRLAVEADPARALAPCRGRPGALGRACLLALALSLPGGREWRGDAAEPSLKVGDPFPDVSRFGLEGTLPDSVKHKVLVVDFWASWCGRCKGSFELLQQLQKRFEQRGLIILSVNVDESRSAMEEYLKEHPVTFPVVRDKNKSLVRAINIPSMPTFLIVDPESKVHSIHGSFTTQEARNKCMEEIEELLRPKKNS